MYLLAVMSYNLIKDPQIFWDEVVVWVEQELERFSLPASFHPHFRSFAEGVWFED